jgi:hypothetical protein
MEEERVTSPSRNPRGMSGGGDGIEASATEKDEDPSLLPRRVDVVHDQSAPASTPATCWYKAAGVLPFSRNASSGEVMVLLGGEMRGG